MFAKKIFDQIDTAEDILGLIVFLAVGYGEMKKFLVRSTAVPAKSAQSSAQIEFGSTSLRPSG
jgi:hypothetical protein